MTLHDPPYRLCCGRPHWGVVCPDGKVMCELCFKRVNQEDLHRIEEGDLQGMREDVCQKCHDLEVMMMRIRAI